MTKRLVEIKIKFPKLHKKEIIELNENIKKFLNDKEIYNFMIDIEYKDYEKIK